MRRFASVFSSRRDKPDAPSTVSSNDSSQQVPKKSRGFASLARRALQPSLPPLIAGNLANSSSSSSSGSTTLRTPDDDGLPHKLNKTGSWKSWLGTKKHNDLTGDEKRLASRPPSNTTLSQPHIDSCNAAVDDAGSSPSEEGSEHSVSMVYSSSQIARARAHARIMITNSLIQQPTAPPLLEAAEFAPFPRSCSPYRHLPRRDTLESRLHKKALLSHLDRSSPLEEPLIAKWLSKIGATAQNTIRDPWHDFFPASSAIMECSKGLRSWVSRPYYEERIHVWTREESGGVVCSRVAGPQLGVAALEYSEVLDLLARTLPGPSTEEFEGAAFDPTAALLPSSQGKCSPQSSLLFFPKLSAAPIIKLQLPEIVALDIECPLATVTSEPSLTLPLPNPESSGSPAIASAVGVSAPKRGVRFAEDDSKDDQIPLGYVLRKRKNKEQKAKFLRQERERRASQVELAMQEEERARKEAERLELEKLRRAREMERRRVEDQEKQRAYMGELYAARARREASRAGQASAFFIHPPGGDRTDTPAGASARRNSSSRGSELIVPTMNTSYDGSPASSLPATPGSQISFSRPPSVYSAHTASSEDVRREARRIRRSSMVPDPSKQMPLQVPYDPRASFMPFGTSWGSIPPVPPIPPIHMMPVVPFVNAIPLYGMEMPLLPPAAPFMMDQYRSRSSRSYNSSQSQESLRQHSNQPSRNHSSDRISSRSGSSHIAPHHRRRSSDGPVVAGTSGRAALDRDGRSQHDLRSSSTHPEYSRSSSYRHSDVASTSSKSPKRTSVAQPQPHPSPSPRRSGAS
ncbi:hypothetical protein SCLCIDRAFT_895165 [Scleroderma citrinum Foug A]|uniref:Uncharacterized protein n=1 Tax=Scleroderma citrinum Foug A TaxID=1036808 RepID=A0A0C3AV04_9AGAM|nr:hypothetical protein SCLCIDRAFT_895165 [Scleroderma citrinum Foug A]